MGNEKITLVAQFFFALKVHTMAKIEPDKRRR